MIGPEGVIFTWLRLIKFSTSIELIRKSLVVEVLTSEYNRPERQGGIISGSGDMRVSLTLDKT